MRMDSVAGTDIYVFHIYEDRSENPRVVGSIPTLATIFPCKN
jgi:hypothetical protein